MFNLTLQNAYTSLPVEPLDYHTANHHKTHAHTQWKECESGKYCDTLLTVLLLIGVHVVQGLSTIPAVLINCLDVGMREVANMYSGIIKGEPMPSDWLVGRVSLVLKNDSDATSVLGYGPIIVTTVFHYIFAHTVKGRLGIWADYKGIFMASVRTNGSRTSQCIEVKRMEAQVFVSCFQNQNRIK